MANRRSPRVTIEVTEELIDQAVRGDSGHCMIAEAVKAAYPNARYVSVDLQTIRFSDPTTHERYTYLTPRAAQVALVDFDQGAHPQPMRFQLRGAQVTPSGSRQARSGKAASEAQRRAAAKATAASKQVRARLTNEPAGDVPDKIGGRTPPTTPIARRRAFGLRALR